MKDSARKFWFRFFWRDWLTSPSIAALTLEQEAAYLRLMSYHYDCGSLPNDHAALERMVGKRMTKGAIAGVAALFSPMESDPTRLVHSRVLEELAEIKEWMEKCSEGGKKSAETRALRRKGASTTLATTLASTPSTKPQLNSNKTSTKPQLNASQSQSQLQEGTISPSAPTHVEVKGQPNERSGEIEPPPGFPRDEAEAIASAQMVGVPADVAEREYHQAVSRGYVDGRGQPIRVWRSYVKSAHGFAIDREARQVRRQNRQETLIGTSTPADSEF